MTRVWLQLAYLVLISVLIVLSDLACIPLPIIPLYLYFPPYHKRRVCSDCDIQPATIRAKLCDPLLLYTLPHFPEK